ncbi:MAG: hypothetical protein JNL98_06050 [Bryobacterales bacterium]|nr:hypothetical protein [Bryobacterales bacterium]
MSNQIKVVKGTRSISAPRLCDSCGNSVVMRGPADGQEQVFCSEIRGHVTMRVTECSRYEDRGKPSLWDMRSIAWVLDTDSKRQRIGFLPASEWEEKHPDEEMIPSRH